MKNFKITVDIYFNEIDYSKLINKNKHNSYKNTEEYKRIQKLRYQLNSVETIKEQYQILKYWRSSSLNRDLDKRVFNIPKNAYLKDYKEIDENLNNLYYDSNNDIQNMDELKYDYENLDNNKDLKLNLNEKLSNIGKIFKNIIKYWKFILLTIFLFGLLNSAIFTIGFIMSIGETPFEQCSTKGKAAVYNLNDIKGITKEKDGYKMPVEYMHAGKGYTGKGLTGGGWDGPDNERGIGIYASEDFYGEEIFGLPGDTFSREHYAVAGRWEYTQYHVLEGMWPGHDQYGSKTADGVDTSKPFYDLDMKGFAWHPKQRVLVINPENGKAVVCEVGNGKDNPNWGGSPLSAGPLGLSYLAQQALGFTGVPELPGEDYKENCRDSGVTLEAYFVDENTEPGIYEGDFSSLVNELARPENKIDGSKSRGTKRKKPKKCNTYSGLGGGNESIAEAAVSYAHETTDIAIPNSGPNNGNGTDLYVKVHDKVFEGDPWYQSCDRSAMSAVRWAGADDEVPAGGCPNLQHYFPSKPDLWEDLGAIPKSEMKPGDVMLSYGHVALYVGNEAVRKKFPDSDGDGVQGSIGFASSPEQQQSIENNWGPAVFVVGNDVASIEARMGGPYKVWRNKGTQKDSKYKDILKGEQ